jgi:uncharacterized membrane protein YgaE (UPF0421/DUF939 family)
MFESRLQTAQFCLAAAALFAVTAVLVFMFGAPAVGVWCLLLEHATAAVGCALYADSKGYSPLIGIPLGVGLGVMGSVMLLILPDETKENVFERERRLASEAIRNARMRDPGYEVLDDEDD